jgi:hypothetical protein
MKEGVRFVVSVRQQVLEETCVTSPCSLRWSEEEEEERRAGNGEVGCGHRVGMKTKAAGTGKTTKTTGTTRKRRNKMRHTQ